MPKWCGRAGDSRMLRQIFVARAGHCAFTPAETISAVQVLLNRVRTGRWNGCRALHGERSQRRGRHGTRAGLQHLRGGWRREAWPRRRSCATGPSRTCAPSTWRPAADRSRRGAGRFRAWTADRSQPGAQAGPRPGPRALYAQAYPACGLLPGAGLAVRRREPAYVVSTADQSPASRRGTGSAPSARACTSTLPSAVASTGPASTGSPHASAVSWQSSSLRAPPPTI